MSVVTSSRLQHFDRARLWRPTLAAVVALTGMLCIACGSRNRASEEEAAAYREAHALQDQGMVDEALVRYQDLMRSEVDPEIRVLAEIGVTWIEQAREQRGVIRERLLSLPGDLDRLNLDGVEDMIDTLVSVSAKSPYRDEIAALADEVRRTARDMADQARETQIAAARTLIDRGEFTAALEFLRSVERRRAEEDRQDIIELLVELRTVSMEDGDEVLVQAEQAGKGSPQAAVRLLDAQLPRFLGTPAYARLLGARIRLAKGVQVPGHDGAADTSHSTDEG